LALLQLMEQALEAHELLIETERADRRLLDPLAADLSNHLVGLDPMAADLSNHLVGLDPMAADLSNHLVGLV